MPADMPAEGRQYPKIVDFLMKEPEYIERKKKRSKTTKNGGSRLSNNPSNGKLPLIKTKTGCFGDNLYYKIKN